MPLAAAAASALLRLPLFCLLSGLRLSLLPLLLLSLQLRLAAFIMPMLVLLPLLLVLLPLLLPLPWLGCLVLLHTLVSSGLRLWLISQWILHR